VAQLEHEASPDSTVCTFKDLDVRVPDHDLPCTYDWANEPVQIGKSGRPMKAKPIPKRCTRACRQYSPPPEPDFAALEPYTDEEVRVIERELLGVYLSSTPFNILPDDVLADVSPGHEVIEGPMGNYIVAAIVTSVRAARDRNGNPMGFLTLYAQDESFDVVVFKDTWATHRHKFKLDQLCLARVVKNSRGINLAEYETIP
jgi:DNA polymerase III alpha subunit